MQSAIDNTDLIGVCEKLFHIARKEWINVWLMLYMILIISFFFEVSYGDGDSNALILPTKKMKKRKEMEQVGIVWTWLCVLSICMFTHFVWSILFCIRNVERNVVKSNQIRNRSWAKLRKRSWRNQRFVGVWTKKDMIFVSSFFVLGLSLFGSFHLYRMTRRSNFCWKKPWRH